ncbi:MAG: hypothetical protein ACK47B_10770 [Armatimonadota bacterium]
MSGFLHITTLCLPLVLMASPEKDLLATLAARGITVVRDQGRMTAHLEYPDETVGTIYRELTLAGASAGLSLYFVDNWLDVVKPVRVSVYARLRGLARFGTNPKPSLGDLAASITLKEDVVRQHLIHWYFHPQPDNLEWLFFRAALEIQRRPGGTYEFQRVLLEDLLHPRHLDQFDGMVRAFNGQRAFLFTEQYGPGSVAAVAQPLSAPLSGGIVAHTLSVTPDGAIVAPLSNPSGFQTPYPSENQTRLKSRPLGIPDGFVADPPGNPSGFQTPGNPPSPPYPPIPREPEPEPGGGMAQSTATESGESAGSEERARAAALLADRGFPEPDAARLLDHHPEAPHWALCWGEWIRAKRNLRDPLSFLAKMIRAACAGDADARREPWAYTALREREEREAERVRAQVNRQQVAAARREAAVTQPAPEIPAELRPLWETLLPAIRAKSPTLFGLLESAAPVRIDAGCLVILTSAADHLRRKCRQVREIAAGAGLELDDVRFVSEARENANG